MIQKFRIGLALQVSLWPERGWFAPPHADRWTLPAHRHSAVCKLAVCGRQAVRVQELPQPRLVRCLHWNAACLARSLT